MLSFNFRHQFLRRLRATAPPGQRHQIERVLAIARLFLAISANVAIYLDPTQPARFDLLASVLLLIYLIHAVGVWFALRGRDEVSRTLPWVLQGVDLLFPAVITWFTEGASSPFYPFFFFAIMAAAFRWAFTETVVTAIIADVLLFLQAGFSTIGGKYLHPVLALPVEINTFVVRIAYLLIVACLLGYLSQKEKELRAQSVVTARLLEEARLRGGVRGTIAATIGEVLRLFEAPRAVLALQDAASRRVFLWHAQPAPGGQVVLEVGEARVAELQAWFPDEVPATFFAAKRKSGTWKVVALTPEGQRRRQPLSPGPEHCPGADQARTLLVVPVVLGEEWSGRMIVYDAYLGLNHETELRFAQELMQRVGPRAYAVYLMHQLRSRAGAIERARVARELHDGAIQSLIGAEMRVDVLRRQPNGQNAAELAEIQQVLRNEVLNLRELMQQMKPVELEPQYLLDYMADMVDRFRRETSIAARFVSDLQDTDVPRHTCRELVRILQEGLVNVRKHSGAKNVLVHFRSEEGRWKLIIEDDGRGFGFTGRMSAAELDSPRQGPAIIKERVRGIGGDLIIDSDPNRGSRLEISIPYKTGYNLRAEAAHD